MLHLFRSAPATPAPNSSKRRQHRQSQRFTVPVFDIPIHGVLQASDGRHLCQLWDVSEQGACLLLRNPLEPCQDVLMSLHPPGGGQTIERRAQVIWVDAVMDTYYAGLQFAQPIDLTSTFLGCLVRNAATLSSSAG